MPYVIFHNTLEAHLFMRFASPCRQANTSLAKIIKFPESTKNHKDKQNGSLSSILKIRDCHINSNITQAMGVPNAFYNGVVKIKVRMT